MSQGSLAISWKWIFARLFDGNGGLSWMIVLFLFYFILDMFAFTLNQSLCRQRAPFQVYIKVNWCSENLFNRCTILIYHIWSRSLHILKTGFLASFLSKTTAGTAIGNTVLACLEFNWVRRCMDCMFVLLHGVNRVPLMRVPAKLLLLSSILILSHYYERVIDVMGKASFSEQN